MFTVGAVMAEQGHLKDLTPDPMNARLHNPRNIGMVVNSLHEVGAARSIVVDEDNVILAGNGTIEAAAQAGIERVRFVDADGDEIIAVRRSNLTPDQKTKLKLYDNRTAELATWDPDVLVGLQDDGADLSAFWFDSELISVLDQSPDFEPVGLDEQGRLDEKASVCCPECGHTWVPS